MLPRLLLVLVAAGACGSSDSHDPPGLDGAPPEQPSGLPDKLEELGCAWEDRVAGGYAVDLAFTSDGGLVVGGGISHSAQEAASWLRRYSATGEVVWTTETSYDDHPGAIGGLALDAGDRIGLAGNPYSSMRRWTARYRANGELAWWQDLDGGGGEDVCFAPTGELYATGSVIDPDDPFSSSFIWIGKFAASGDLLWEHAEEGLGPGRSVGWALVCDESGGVVVVGDRVGPDSYGQSWIRRYDPAGDELWTTVVEAESGTFPEAMVPSATGDEVLVTIHILDHTQLYRLDLADGAIRSDTLAPDKYMLAADEGGLLVDGNFSVKTDPDCDFVEEECETLAYRGYAYYDWDAELVWWRAETRGVSDDAVSQLNALVTRDGVVAVAGIEQDGIWVCYR